MKELTNWVSVDVESDGPIPGKNSMISFGAVLVNDTTKTFYGKIKPISPDWVPEALAVSKINRNEHLTYDDPFIVMSNFERWLNNNTTKPQFVSDNNGYDFAWINWYFHNFLGRNPFGHSSRRIGDLWCGYVLDLKANREWKKFRRTKHTHNPVDDAKGNAEALKEIVKQINETKNQ